MGVGILSGGGIPFIENENNFQLPKFFKLQIPVLQLKTKKLIVRAPFIKSTTLPFHFLIDIVPTFNVFKPSLNEPAGLIGTSLFNKFQKIRFSRFEDFQK